MSELSFSLLQVLSLIGLVQCVFILVHIGADRKNWRYASVPFIYFFVLAMAFFLDFAREEIASLFHAYEVVQWLFWFYGPPLSVLLIIRLVYPQKALKNALFLTLLLPLIVGAAVARLYKSEWGCDSGQECRLFFDGLFLLGVIAGALSLLAIWLNRRMIQEMHTHKFGRERYWIVLSIIAANIGFLYVMMSSLEQGFNSAPIIITRSIIGLGFVYLITTSLFRVYPQTRKIKEVSGEITLSSNEIKIAQKIDNLLRLEKVYQEPSYNRSDLARELDISEGVLSRIINNYYKKSLPQLMNIYRLEDAKRLLKQTGAPVKVIAEEVGFNSLASFNRVFKEEVGMSPTLYRQQNIEKIIS